MLSPGSNDCASGYYHPVSAVRLARRCRIRVVARDGVERGGIVRGGFYRLRLRFAEDAAGDVEAVYGAHRSPDGA
jgi:hypothetical protein